MARPVAELEREDLELEVGGAWLAARRLRPGCGHAPHHDAPPLVAELIASWLRPAVADRDAGGGR